MSPIPNPRVIFNSIPKDYPVPGETLVYQKDTETIDLDTVKLDGGVLVKALDLSLDPYMRWRLRDPSIKSYAPPFDLGKVPSGAGIALVIRSESPQVKAGDHILVSLPWSQYSVIPAQGVSGPLSNPSNLPWSTFLGVGGMPGRTAFYSLHAFANWKAGETIFVSTAAGAVGSVVVQLAKLAGLRVIGSTGDDEKVKFLTEELGADLAFNYKTTDTREFLAKHGPIDLYYDNVGGPTLEAAIENFNNFGRIICCGYASEYNKTPDTPSYGIKSFSQILVKSLTVNGFIVGNLVAKFGIELFEKEFEPLLANGTIKYKEHRTKGLENLGDALLEILKGDNMGKAVLVVAEE